MLVGNCGSGAIRGLNGQRAAGIVGVGDEEINGVERCGELELGDVVRIQPVLSAGRGVVAALEWRVGTVEYSEFVLAGAASGRALAAGTTLKVPTAVEREVQGPLVSSSKLVRVWAVAPLLKFAASQVLRSAVAIGNA